MSTSTHNNARLAVDIGGTFTDLAIEKDGQRWTAKVLTTPTAPEKGVLEGVQQVLAKAAMKPADLALVIHGTTLATNAMIERKGAKTALITTDGFRDVLALANEARYDQYDLNIELAKPLVPRRWRLPQARPMWPTLSWRRMPRPACSPWRPRRRSTSPPWPWTCADGMRRRARTSWSTWPRWRCSCRWRP